MERESERALLGKQGMAKRYNRPEQVLEAVRELVFYRAERAVSKVEAWLVAAGIPDNEIDDLVWNAFKEVFYGGEETPK